MARLPENFTDLVEYWTLLPAETDLLAGKHDGATKLGFALLLKFYGRYGRFPRGRAELRRRGHHPLDHRGGAPRRAGLAAPGPGVGH